MQVLVIAMFVSATWMSYLVSLNVLPQAFRYLPEACSAIAALYVVIAGMRTRFAFVRVQYWIVFGVATVIVMCGAIANHVDSGPIIAGLRWHLRTLPFFLLPAVYAFSIPQLRRQLGVLTAIALLQFPLAFYQRITQVSEGHATGDNVMGSVMGSGNLTIFLIGAVCIALAMRLRERISMLVFTVLFVLFTTPTGINETKVTVFLYPVAVLCVVLVAAAPGKRLRMIGVSAALIAAAAMVFVPLYNYFGKQNVATKDAFAISDMFTDPDFFKHYLDQGTDVGSKKEVGRLDAVTVPVSVVTKDWVTLAFGYGVGNASNSSLGSSFSGDYGPTLWTYTMISFGAVILETGVFGLLCVLGFHWLVIRDSQRLARMDQGFLGALGAGWFSIVIMMTLMLFYSNALQFESLGYLFAYFSGVVAAERVRLARSQSRGLTPVRS